MQINDFAIQPDGRATHGVAAAFRTAPVRLHEDLDHDSIDSGVDRGDAMTSGSLIKPPDEVPPGLGEREYVKLTVRYSMIPKWRQCMTAQKYLVERGQTGPGELTEEQRQTFAVVLEVLTSAMQAQEVVQNAKGWVFDRLMDGASLANAKLDQIDSIKQPKSKVQGFITELGKKAVSTFDNVVENVLLPSLGLPLKGIPIAKSADEYYSLGRKYLLAGLHSRAAICFHKSIDMDATSPAARAASTALRTEIPFKKASEEAEKKLMRAKELFVIGRFNNSIEVCREGIHQFPEHAPFYLHLANLLITEGELEEPDRLVATALKLFPDYIDALLARARIDMIGLQLTRARYALEKLLTLCPDHRNAQSYLKSVQLMESMGD